MLRVFEYRLVPSKTQRAALAQNAGNARWLYNHFLAQRIEAYKDSGQTLSSYDQIKQLPELKKEFDWLKASESTSLQQVAFNLNMAYQNFFRRVKQGAEAPGFPKFKRKGVRDSFRIMNVSSSIRIWNPEEDEEDWGTRWCQIKLAKLGWFKLVYHRPIPEDSKIKNVAVKLHSDGNWYVSVLVEDGQEFPEPINPKQAAKNSIGVDFGLKDFVTLSNGEKVSSPQFYRSSQRKLAKLQRSLSRKANGSKNREKARKRVAKQHFHVAQQRRDFLNKLSYRLVNRFDLITLETLNIQGMSQNQRLSKSILDSGWGMFVSMLRYKAAERGKHLVQADPWFASSQISYYTGERNRELTLADRTWADSAGNLLDRDINAAMNLNYVGQHFITTGELLNTEGYLALYQ